MYDIALVGSRGFLGSAIAGSLRSRGASVAAFTRESPIHSDGVIAAEAAHVNVVVWAAGALSPTLAHQRPDLVHQELEEFQAAVDAVSRRADPPRLILLSSGGTVYGGGDGPPFRETVEPAPTNAYGEFKLAQEHIVAELGDRGCSVRISNAFGPGQRGARGQGVLAVWMQSILAGEAVRIHGSGSVARDYVYVDDVADAIVRVVETEDAQAIVNVGSGVPTTLDQLADEVRAVVGEGRVRIERLPSRGMDAASTWLDVSRARDRLGWVPKTTLREGIERMWRWMEHR